jgi:hypothetical protein
MTADRGGFRQQVDDLKGQLTPTIIEREELDQQVTVLQGEVATTST